MSRKRGTATAAAIEEAALDLVLERGYEHVTVDLICAAAGVSQRTFFNHFPTKDDAILGRAAPGIDEHAARRFIVGTGPLLQEVLSLVSPPADGATGPRLADRMRAVSSSPALLAGHIARVAAIDAEVAELVALRLGAQDPGLSDRQRDEAARMVANMLGAIMRWIAVAASEEETADAPFDELAGQARETLERVIERSLPRRTG